MHFQTGQVGAEAQICLLLASFCSLPLSRDSPPPLPHPQEILSSDKNTLELMDLTRKHAGINGSLATRDS